MSNTKQYYYGDTGGDEEALKIHGYINSTTDSDSGKSEFDDEYYKYKPAPMKVSKSKIVNIINLTNITNLVTEENTEAERPEQNSNQQRELNSARSGTNKKARHKPARKLKNTFYYRPKFCDKNKYKTKPESLTTQEKFFNIQQFDKGKLKKETKTQSICNVTKHASNSSGVAMQNKPKLDNDRGKNYYNGTKTKVKCKQSKRKFFITSYRGPEFDNENKPAEKKLNLHRQKDLTTYSQPSSSTGTVNHSKLIPTNCGDSSDSNTHKQAASNSSNRYSKPSNSAYPQPSNAFTKGITKTEDVQESNRSWYTFHTTAGKYTPKKGNDYVNSGAAVDNKTVLHNKQLNILSPPTTGSLGVNNFAKTVLPNPNKTYSRPSSSTGTVNPPKLNMDKNSDVRKKTVIRSDFIQPPSVHRTSNLGHLEFDINGNSKRNTNTFSYPSAAVRKAPSDSSKISYSEATRQQREIIASAIEDFNNQADNVGVGRSNLFNENPHCPEACQSQIQPVPSVVDSSVIDEEVNLLEEGGGGRCCCVIL